MRIAVHEINKFGISSQEIAANLVSHILLSHIKGTALDNGQVTPLFLDAPHAHPKVEDALREYRANQDHVTKLEYRDAIDQPIDDTYDKLNHFVSEIESHEFFPLELKDFEHKVLPLLAEDKAYLIQKAQGMRRYVGLFKDDNSEDLSFSVNDVNAGSTHSISYEDMMTYSQNLGSTPTVFLTFDDERAKSTVDGMNEVRRLTLHPRNPYFVRDFENMWELKDHPQLLNEIRQHKYDCVLSLDLGDCIVLHPSVFNRDFDRQLNPDFYAFTNQPDDWDKTVIGARHVVSTLGLIIEKHGIQHAVHIADQLHSIVSKMDRGNIQILSNAHRLVMREMATDLRIGAPGFRAVSDSLIGDVLKSRATLVSYEPHTGLPEGQGILRFYSHQTKLDEFFESFSFDTRTQKRMDGFMSPDVSNKVVTQLPSSIMDTYTYWEAKQVLDSLTPLDGRDERNTAIDNTMHHLLVGQIPPEERVFCKMMAIAGKHYFEGSIGKNPAFTLSTLIDFLDVMPISVRDEVKHELWNQSSHQLNEPWIDAAMALAYAPDDIGDKTKALSLYVDSLKKEPSVDIQFSAVAYLISEIEFKNLKIIASLADKMAIGVENQLVNDAKNMIKPTAEPLKIGAERDAHTLNQRPR